MSLASKTTTEPRKFSYPIAGVGIYFVYNSLAAIPQGPTVFGNVGRWPELTWFIGPMFFASALFGLALIFNHLIRETTLRAAMIGIWLLNAVIASTNHIAMSPDQPFLGWTILALAVLGTEAYRKPDSHLGQKNIFEAWTTLTWLLSASGYFRSAFNKIVTPSWTNGVLMENLLTTPLASDWMRVFIGAPKIIFQSAGLAVIALEALVVVGLFYRKARPILWIALVTFHCFNILALRLETVSFGLLLFHFFQIPPEIQKRFGPKYRSPAIQ